MLDPQGILGVFFITVICLLYLGLVYYLYRMTIYYKKIVIISNHRRRKSSVISSIPQRDRSRTTSSDPELFRINRERAKSVIDVLAADDEKPLEHTTINVLHNSNSSNLAITNGESHVDRSINNELIVKTPEVPAFPYAVAPLVHTISYNRNTPAIKPINSNTNSNGSSEVTNPLLPTRLLLTSDTKVELFDQSVVCIDRPGYIGFNPFFTKRPLASCSHINPKKSRFVRFPLVLSYIQTLVDNENIPGSTKFNDLPEWISLAGLNLNIRGSIDRLLDVLFQIKSVDGPTSDAVSLVNTNTPNRDQVTISASSSSSSLAALFPSITTTAESGEGQSLVPFAPTGKRQDSSDILASFTDTGSHSPAKPTASVCSGAPKSIGLDLARCQLNHLQASAILDAFYQPQLAAKIHIESLDLSENVIDSAFSATMGMYLQNSDCVILELSLSRCQLGDVGAEIISMALRVNKTVRHLDLSHCGIDRVGCYYIASALGEIPVDPKIVTVKTPTMARSASTAVRSSAFLEDIFSSNNNSNSSSNLNGTTGGSNNPPSKSARADSNTNHETVPQAVAKVTSYNRSVSWLNLEGNSIGPLGARDLARALMTNGTVTRLNVSDQIKGKKIGPDGARDFSKVLRGGSGTETATPGCCQLVEFRCARSNIGFEGCRHISSALLVNETLTELDIGGVNYITIAGAMQLGKAIATNRRSRLAWLTVAEHRLPIAPLLGDRERTTTSSLKPVDMLRMEAAHNGVHAHTTKTPANRRYSLLPALPILSHTHHEHKEKEQSDLDTLEATFSPLAPTAGISTGPNQCAIALISMYPQSLVVRRVPGPDSIAINHGADGAGGGGLEFGATVSTHGMHDEMGIIVGTLLRKNKSLKHLQLEDAQLPVQELIGNPGFSPQSIDLSNKNLNSADAIVVGILVSENVYLKTLNLRDNNFAETEGENFIAYALEKNKDVRLVDWTPEEMFTKNYKTLASFQGMSSTGAMIEPQRLEGWFYQALTVGAMLLFYLNLISDCIVLNIFITERDVYFTAWTVIAGILLPLPTLVYWYNTTRSLIKHDKTEAALQTFIVFFQLATLFQCYECVLNSMESTAWLDYKYAQSVYKSIPQIFLKTYILFYVAINQGSFNFWVLLSVVTSLASITVIYTMIYDRKEARRFSMLSVSVQPWCAVWLANVFTFFGMGQDTEHVQDFVNFDSYYTSHYVWSYVYQILDLFSRVVSVAWMMAAMTSGYQPVLIFIVLWFRFMILLFLDPLFLERPVFFNVIRVFSLTLSDSSFPRSENPRLSRITFILIAFLTSLENLLFIIYAAYVAPTAERGASHQYFSDGLFGFVFIVIILRLVFLFHWALPIHFPNLDGSIRGLSMIGRD